MATPNHGFFHTNDECAEFLMRISNLYRKRNDTYRAVSFETASDVIRTYSEDIGKMPEDFRHIDSIGKSINEEIKQFLETGTSDRYEALKQAAE